MNTPLHIKILLHYHCTNQPIEMANAPSVVDYTKELVSRGLLMRVQESENYPECYSTTEKGGALVEMVCATPDPVQKWIDARGFFHGMRK